MSLLFGYEEKSSEDFDDTELKKDIKALKTGLATNNTKTKSLETSLFKKDGSVQMTGDLDLGDNSIVGIHNINADNSVPSKKYITDELAKKLSLDGSTTMIGTLILRNGLVMFNGMINMANQRIRFLPTPSQDTDAATKKYVDDKTASVVTNTNNITAAGIRLTALENIRRNYTYHFDYVNLTTSFGYPTTNNANRPYHWMYCKNMSSKSRFHVHTFSWDTDSSLESNYILTFRLDFFKQDGAHSYTDIFTARIGDHRIVGERMAFIDKKYDPSTLTEYQNFVMARLAIKGSSVKGNETAVSCSFEI